MQFSVKKIIEFVIIGIAAVGAIVLLKSLGKFQREVVSEKGSEQCLPHTLTASYEIPYHVWIQRTVRRKEKYQCSGTVVHDRYILTAARCVIESVPDEAYKTELKVFSVSRTLNHGRSYDVEKIILHPSYGGKNSYQNDIALIRLKTKLYGWQGQQVAIPLSGKRPTSHEGLELFVSGYGQVRVRNAFIDYDQHKFHMEIVSMARCKELFSDIDVSGKFCAIAASGYKPCMSDIGSPATVNKTHLIGIYIGFKECSKDYVELFIDVTSYSKFITSEITTV